MSRLPYAEWMNGLWHCLSLSWDPDLSYDLTLGLSILIKDWSIFDLELDLGISNVDFGLAVLL